MTGQHLDPVIEKSTLVYTGNDGKNRHFDFEIPISVGADKCFVPSDNGHMYKTSKYTLPRKDGVT